MARVSRLKGKVPVAVAHHAVDPIRRLKTAKLRQALGLELAEDDLALVGRFPKMPSFTQAEVIDLLGDGSNGIPRMLPVDVALGRLGMPIVRALPNGAAQRLTKEFPKAWAARWKSDRAIALHVARTYRDVPKGWYPDRDRLMMGDVVDDAARAAGVPELGPGAREFLQDAVSVFRFDLLPPDLRLAGYQMWHRRRLAGISPLQGDGLVFGFWDDVQSGYDVNAYSFRGVAVALLAMRAMVLRDVAVACACDAAPDAPGRVAYEDGPYADVFQTIVGECLYSSRIGPGQPQRNCGGGLARLYALELAMPGAPWSERPVRERPEVVVDLEGFGLRNVSGPDDLDEGDEVPGDYAYGEFVDPPFTAWVDRFVSA